MIHLRLGYRKNILSASSLVLSLHDLRTEVSHDRGTFKTIELPLITPPLSKVLNITLTYSVKHEELSAFDNILKSFNKHRFYKRDGGGGWTNNYGTNCSLKELLIITICCVCWVGGWIWLLRGYTVYRTLYNQEEHDWLSGSDPL